MHAFLQRSRSSDFRVKAAVAQTRACSTARGSADLRFAQSSRLPMAHAQRPISSVIARAAVSLASLRLYFALMSPPSSALRTASNTMPIGTCRWHEWPHAGQALLARDIERLGYWRRITQRNLVVDHRVRHRMLARRIARRVGSVGSNRTGRPVEHGEVTHSPLHLKQLVRIDETCLG